MKTTIEKKILNIIAVIFTAIVALACLLPFIMVLSASFSTEKEVLATGYSIFPKGFTLNSYKTLFSSPGKIINAYAITISITVIGTSLSLFLTSMTAYVLRRQDFALRNKIAFFIYFTTLFNGGLVVTYFLFIKYYGLRDNYLVMILPNLLSPYYILIMRNFLKSIPYELNESGKIDGAGDFTIFTRIILPLMKPALASIGMFIALIYWNEWFMAMLYINNRNLYPLQYLLYQMLSNAEFLKANIMISDASSTAVRDVPTHTVRMAMTVVTVGPIVLLYPYIQKYFIQGMTVGSVKG